MKKVEGIILAGGFSSRMRKFKMELKLGDKNILERCVEGMESICDRIIVVAGHQYERIQKLTSNLSNVETVINKNYEKGMFSSIRRGIREIKAERFFIIPGDQPLVKSSTYKKMLEINSDIVSPRCNGKKGHPILFKSKLIKEMLNMSDDEILRDFIHKIDDYKLDVDDLGIHLDVDTLEDYEKIKKYYDEEYCGK
ncbi:MAG: nucleotidyltransferase family protein [Candidatus Marinimicrobia bacterium]|nr:nucleotidyltransferase family protein [Candidatus Neomarinimicrobiota bacterium]